MLSSLPRFLCVLTVLGSLLSGCTTVSVIPGQGGLLPSETAETAETFETAADLHQHLVPVVRYGRYTLVELAPTAAQRDLLLQTIDVSMPEDARATVGDGLRHVLKRSGYGLCQTANTVSELYALPLPAAHLRLGPMTLRDAVLTLAGPAWELHADDRARQICFEQSGDGGGAKLAPEPPAADAAQTFPLAGGQP